MKLNNSSYFPGGCFINETVFMTLIPDDLRIDLFYSAWQEIIITILFPIVVLLGVISNSALLVVILYIREMRTITNFYLGNLAVSDMMFNVLSLVRHLRQYAAGHRFTKVENIVTPIGCSLDKAISHIAFFASFGFVLFVSYERYLSICHPFVYRAIVSRKRAAKYVALTWILGTITAILIAPTWWKVRQFCVVWDSNKTAESVSVFYYCDKAAPAFAKLHGLIEFLLFFITFFVSTIFYINIIITLTRRDVPNNHTSTDRSKSHNQVARMVVMNGLVYFCCQVPFQFYNLYDYIGGEFLDERQVRNLSWAARLLEAVNASINPVIYTVANDRYRQAFYQIFIEKCLNRKQSQIRTIAKKEDTKLWTTN